MESNFSIWYGQPKRQNLISFYVPLCLLLRHVSVFSIFHLFILFVQLSFGESRCFSFFPFSLCLCNGKIHMDVPKVRLYSFLFFFMEFFYYFLLSIKLRTFYILNKAKDVQPFGEIEFSICVCLGTGLVLSIT